MIQAGFITGGAKDGLDERADGALAVCPGDVHGRKARLGVAEALQKLGDVCKAALFGAGLLGVVDVIKAFRVIHGLATPSPCPLPAGKGENLLQGCALRRFRIRGYNPKPVGAGPCTRPWINAP